ncbi:MAG: zinc ribbon domain-containing protein [Candidatus Eremiobacterota bacterium]
MRTEDLTDLEAFNHLMKEADRLFQGQCEAGPVVAHARTVESILATLYGSFFEGVALQEDHPLLDELVPLAYQGFQELVMVWPLLVRALELEAANEGRELLERASRALQRIYGVFARLRAYEASLPRHSEVPIAHELIRVGLGVLNGTLTDDALRLRLEQFADYHANLVHGLEGAAPAGREVEVMENHREALMEALEEQGRGIELVDVFLERGDPEALGQALVAVEHSSGVLVTIQRELQAASEPVIRSCMRCWTPYPPTARVCQNCGASLPDLGHLDDDSTALPVEGEELPSNLARLAREVEELQAGDLSPEEFERTLDWLDKTRAMVSERFASMDPPDPQSPPEQLALYEEARSAFQAGLQELAAGLGMLRTYLDRPDPGRLDHGLEQVKHGASQMMKVESLARALAP